MRNIKVVAYLMLLVTLAYSCNKENNSTTNSTTKTQTPGVGNAMIVNTGPVAADGCGFLIKVDSNYYHADNLPEQFQKDSLNVNINYDPSTSKFQCSTNPNNLIPIIHLNSINNICN
ncbi:hypothetical protein ACPPVU_17390 [Mucilaginibacter sp. McL0603]|uniref:hypothetical protein n=1 Tax=Mucilaginibacter sp. McL0603 TaxID=3415670 RepID=UPI003CF01E99